MEREKEYGIPQNFAASPGRFNLISDPNYISRLLRCWQSLDYRFDPSSVRMLGIYLHQPGCLVSC
jgi:hypothetical protein